MPTIFDLRLKVVKIAKKSVQYSSGHRLSSGIRLLLYILGCLQMVLYFVYIQSIVTICRRADLVGSYSPITLNEHGFSYQVYA